MERKAKDTVRRLLKDALILGVLPYVAYLVAQWLFDSALLVGPYLLASPLIAVTIFARTIRLDKLFGAKKTASEADPALSERASRFSIELGLSQVSVFIESEDADSFHPAIRMHEDGLHVKFEQWSQMSEPERDFGMAQTMAYKAKARKPAKVTTWIMDIALFAGYVIATQNLWLILVMHTGGLAAFHYLQQRVDAKTTLAGDRWAIELTGDVSSAESYIRTYDGKIRWLSIDLESRIAALRESWAEMQSA